MGHVAEMVALLFLLLFLLIAAMLLFAVGHIVGGMIVLAFAVTCFLIACFTLHHAPRDREFLKKIAIIESQTEANLLDSILTERNIPHFLKTYEDNTFGGLFWIPIGWGHLEAPPILRKEVEEIIADVRNRAAHTETNTMIGAEGAPENAG